MSKIIIDRDEFDRIIDEMFDEEFGGDGDYIIEFEAKYEYESNFTKYREICCYHYGTDPSEDAVIWFNDWYEGQQDFIFHGAYSIEHLLQMYKDVESALHQHSKALVKGSEENGA